MQQPIPPFATMGPASKKCKGDENSTAAFESISQLSPEDARKILEPFTTEQLLEILQDVVVRHPDVLDAICTIVDRDPIQHELFSHGLDRETTIDGLRTLFSSYVNLDKAVIILDKATKKSKGYIFITFKREKQG